MRLDLDLQSMTTGDPSCAYCQHQQPLNEESKSVSLCITLLHILQHMRVTVNARSAGAVVARLLSARRADPPAAGGRPPRPARLLDRPGGRTSSRSRRSPFCTEAAIGQLRPGAPAFSRPLLNVIGQRAGRAPHAACASQTGPGPNAREGDRGCRQIEKSEKSPHPFSEPDDPPSLYVPLSELCRSVPHIPRIIRITKK